MLNQVRRAGSRVYHLACFACDLCQRQLSTGEQFTIDNQTNESKLLCKLHFGITNEGMRVYMLKVKHIYTLNK